MPDALPASLRGRFDEFLNRISRAAIAAGRQPAKRHHGDAHMACCPAHDDHNPSLSVTLEGSRVLLHCFAGCPPEDVAAAIGMPMEAFFDDYRQQSTREPRICWNGSSRVAGDAVSLPDGGLDESAALRQMPLPPPVQNFLELDFPAAEPLLGPIETQQLVIVYAAPGAGKTMFALNLGYHMSTAQDFIGWTAGKRARVLVVDGEMAGAMMQRRMAHIVGDGDYLRIANLANWGTNCGYEPINLCTEEGHAIVSSWADRCGSNVIILDNLMSLAWMEGVSMNSDEYWQPVRRFCLEQRAKGRTVIVVDHTNKSGGLHGTGTKVWHADLAIHLVPMERAESTLSQVAPPARFSLKFSKVRGTPDSVGQDTDEKAIELGNVGQDWKYESGVDSKKTAARQMAMNGLSIRDIAEEMSTPKSTIARWVKGFTK